MRTAAARDAMIARVNEAFKTHRTLEDWPVTAKWDVSAPIEAPYGQKEYVLALHQLCAEGVPTGRLDGAATIVGKRVSVEETEHTGKVLRAGK